MNRITRVEVIDGEGRSYVNWEDDNDVSWQFQDDGRTLKVFVNKVKPKSPAEETYHEQMTETGKTERELKVLQAYLELLKEMEKHKSPSKEAYKRVYGEYPPTTPSVSNYEDNRWSAFQAGYNASQVIETPQEPEELKTLYQMFYDEECRDDICEVVKNWLPTKRVENKYDADYNSGWNDLLDTLRRTLR